MWEMLSSLRVATRIQILIVISLLGMGILSYLSLQTIRDKMLEGRKDKAHSLVDVGVGVLTHYHELAQKGAMSEADAKVAARETLRNIRYGEKDYYFAFDEKGIYFLNPAKPDWEGKDKSDRKDANGKLLQPEFVAAVKKGGGFVDYMFPRPNTKEPVLKLSYAEKFAPWDLIIGTGIYVDDIDTEFMGLAKVFLELVAGLLLLLFAMDWLIAASLLRQLGGEPTAAVTVAQAVASGKLNNQIKLREGDSQSLLASMSRMQTQLVERINEEHQLAAQNLRIKIALDNVSTGVMIADNSHQIIYANDAVHKVLSKVLPDIRKIAPEFSLQTLIGENIDLFYKFSGNSGYKLEKANTNQIIEIELGHLHITLTTNPVVNEQGESVGFVTEWLDRTAEVEAEEEISALVKAAATGNFEQRITLDNKEGFFLDVAKGLNELSEIIYHGLSDVARILQWLAAGDLTHRAATDYQGIFGQLQKSTNVTVDYLQNSMAQITQAIASITTASKEIAAGNQDLSSRTEEQAASLEETASSIEEFSSTVKHNASNATQANELAKISNQIATRGGEIVQKVVHTMSDIQESSNRISEIIGVIDGIAFQTNILALNAAVEAARAGEQGRGFAVVASEVRNLAQRSASAAREIKGLITESVTKVQEGASLVDQAGHNMSEVVQSFQQVANLVTDISKASQEQSSGIVQVTNAIEQIDQATQQNAALVEQATAAAMSLEEQAQMLATVVSRFQLK